MEGHRVACIAGTHGKTSTTSMLTVALQHCRLDPSFAIGGDLNESGANAHHGDRRHLRRRGRRERRLVPDLLAVGRGRDQCRARPPRPPRHRRGLRRRCSPSSSAGIEPGGLLIVCGDDAPARRAGGAGPKPRACGCGATAARSPATATRSVLDYTPGAGRRGRAASRRRRANCRCGSRCRVSTWRSTRSPRCWPGSSWARRSSELAEGLAAFGGVRRRFEFKGRAGDVRVYDDYAHHPTEVDAQLRAVRHAAGDGPGDRAVPAAPVLADEDLRRRVRRGAEPGRRGRGARRVTARARSRSRA